MDLQLLYKWINFSIFSAGLFYFLKEPIRDFLGDRREALRRELEEIAKEHRNIERRYQEYRMKLAQADSEADRLKKELKEEGEEEKTILLRKAHAFAQRIRDDAVKVSEQELSRAKFFLRRQTMLLAVDLAGELVKKSLDIPDQQRLFVTSIQQLERLA